MVSIASVAITASQHIWCSSNLILLVGPKVVYISLTRWQSRLSLFCSFILPAWTINSVITTFKSCWKDHYLFFLNTWGSNSVGPGELSQEDGAWCFKWFCLFWGEQVCDSKAHQQDWWFVCLVLFLLLFGDRSDSRFQCWRAIHCAHSGGDVRHLDSLRWAAQKCHDGASSQFDEQHCFFFQLNRWALLLDSSGINRMIIKDFIVL